LTTGIIVAGCLQEVLKISFTDASILTKHVQHNSSTSTIETIIRQDLFNVYGPVRLTTCDIDDWYINMKNRVLQSNIVAARSDNNFTYTPYTRKTLGDIAKNVVSFHYISEAESRLLFQMLSGVVRPSTESALVAMWPRGRAVGDYARPLKSLKEAKMLLEQINNIDVATNNGV
jgi:hypothetical protein